MRSLPDVSLWFALAYAGHPHHSAAKRWFERSREPDSLLFCRVTQMGMLRLLTQRAAMGSSCLSQAGAWEIYDQLRSDRRVNFRHEPLGLEIVFQRASSRDEAAAKLWTDDYLTAFAEILRLQIVSFDRALVKRSAGALLLEA